VADLHLLPHITEICLLARAAFLVVASLDVLAAAASALLWWRTRPIYQREYLLVRFLHAKTL